MEQPAIIERVARRCVQVLDPSPAGASPAVVMDSDAPGGFVGATRLLTAPEGRTPAFVNASCSIALDACAIAPMPQLGSATPTMRLSTLLDVLQNSPNASCERGPLLYKGKMFGFNCGPLPCCDCGSPETACAPLPLCRSAGSALLYADLWTPPPPPPGIEARLERITAMVAELNGTCESPLAVMRQLVPRRAHEGRGASHLATAIPTRYACGGAVVCDAAAYGGLVQGLDLSRLDVAALQRHAVVNSAYYSAFARLMEVVEEANRDGGSGVLFALAGGPSAFVWQVSLGL